MTESITFADLPAPNHKGVNNQVEPLKLDDLTERGDEVNIDALFNVVNSIEHERTDKKSKKIKLTSG